jgi:tetratricopeptide (TPR) repeat protein
MKLGELMIATHSDRAAAAVFETGLKNLPDSPLLHFGLAICYLAGSRNWDEAHQHLREALKLRPGFEPALELLCYTGAERKEWKPLRSDAEELIRLDPRSARGYYYRALALQGAESETGKGGLLAQSLAALDRALQLDPRYVDAWVEKGKLLVRLTRLQPAVTAFETAAAVDPECEEAYFQLARLYRRVGDEAKSQEASAIHARLNRAKREESERWQGLFQLQEGGRGGGAETPR